MTLMGHLFSKHWFHFFYTDIFKMFFGDFYYTYTPYCITLAARGEVFHAAVSAEDCCMRDVQVIPVGS